MLVCTFLRENFIDLHAAKAPLVKGSWRAAPEGLSPAAADGFPYEGKLSPEATDEVDNAV